MVDEIVIYGKAACPFTGKAISAYGKRTRYIDVGEDSAQFQIMLKLTNGVRQIPVIVERGQITIGYGGV
ncbi:MAG: UXX-star (seleno)protein family 1 [Deltaproteobacteria bacterium]|nr:UXX-star (seleno)protein family 1 [Deltaproteobacteria bacterium]